MDWLRVFVLTLAAAMLWAAPAVAQQCQAPPGTAAVDEYCETIPSTTGEGAGSRGSGAPQPLPRNTVRALERAGEDGKGLNRFFAQDPNASSTAGDKKRGRGAPSDGTPGSAKGGTTTEEPASNPLKAIRSAVSSGETVGDVFVWAILVIIVLMVGIGWVRFRRQSTA